MVKLSEETDVQRSLTERLVRSRLQWTGHVDMMADDRLPKRTAIRESLVVFGNYAHEVHHCISTLGLFLAILV